MDMDELNYMPIYSPVMANIVLRDLDNVHSTIEWAVRHGRKFHLQSGNMCWIIQTEIHPDENITELEKIFNEPKTKN